MSNILHTQIPPGSNFSDSFWDNDYKGVDIVLSKLKRSKETCEEIKKLYESRAHIEQEYGERLLKLSATSKIGQCEEGSFAETLSRIPSTLETTARAHIDLAQQLRDHLEMPLDGFLKEQREIRKREYAHIENLKQLKKLHENEVARAKDHYSTESTKLISLETHFTAEMEKEIEEQKRVVAVAEQVYKRAIDNLNFVNDQWINDWKHTADVYQEMELKRTIYLRSTLWSFSNIMTSTFNIDEECCDRIRAALEITDVQKDIVDFVYSYRTGTQPPVSIPYESFYRSVQKSPFSHQNSSESLARSITVLTNHDEELKSVDIQLQQLGQSQTPKADVTQELKQNPEHVCSAIEEVEQMLNQTNVQINATKPENVSSPTTFENETETRDDIHRENVIKEASSLNMAEKNQNPLNILEKEPTATGEPEKIKEQSNYDSGDKKAHGEPINENKCNESTRTVHQAVQSVDIEDDDENPLYERTMPMPPPKDEKWVISSIRRPQQIPIKITNSPSFQDPLLSPEYDTTSMSISTSKQHTEESKVHEAKAHKPAIPLSIDIPSPINKNPQFGPHQVVDDPRMFHQMPNNNGRLQIRMEENGGIRPAPWQGIIPPEDTKKGYVSHHSNYQNGYVRSEQMGSNNPEFQIQQHGAPIYNEKASKNKTNPESTSNKPGKETKSAGRFSLFFTGGNKKDKKKEKDSLSDLQNHFPQPQLQQQIDQQASIQHATHQSNTTSDTNANNEAPYSQPLQALPSANTSNRFIGFAKAQWPFEATIEAEMSFNQDEVIGIIHKQSDGWWQAERISSEMAGQRGLVPGNYMIDTPLEHHR
ncbi:hypothetical protein BY458DRAFT_523827 [Sporodiniella umbellata]|nr:hypothetical protein BY458DRAFT_523827 [Sporodiniella umbellata]